MKYLAHCFVDIDDRQTREMEWGNELHEGDNIGIDQQWFKVDYVDEPYGEETVIYCRFIDDLDDRKICRESEKY